MGFFGLHDLLYTHTTKSINGGVEAFFFHGSSVPVSHERNYLCQFFVGFLSRLYSAFLMMEWFRGDEVAGIGVSKGKPQLVFPKKKKMNHFHHLLSNV